MAKSTITVLFICAGNICRSPYAEIAANRHLSSAVRAVSAGTHALAGHPMDPDMAHLVGAPVEHRAQQLTQAICAEADIVLAMAADHRRYVIEEWPKFATKTFVIGQAARELAFAPKLALADIRVYLSAHRSASAADSVADPYRRGPEAAFECARKIDSLLVPIVDRLNGSGGS